MKMRMKVQREVICSIGVVYKNTVVLQSDAYFTWWQSRAEYTFTQQQTSLILVCHTYSGI